MDWRLWVVSTGVIIFIFVMALALTSEKFLKMLSFLSEQLRYRSFNPFDNFGKLSKTFDEKLEHDCNWSREFEIDCKVKRYGRQMTDAHWAMIRNAVANADTLESGARQLGWFSSGEFRREAQDELLEKLSPWALKRDFENSINEDFEFLLFVDDPIDANLDKLRAVHSLLNSSNDEKVEIGRFLVNENYGNIQSILSVDEFATLESGVAL